MLTAYRFTRSNKIWADCLKTFCRSVFSNTSLYVKHPFGSNKRYNSLLNFLLDEKVAKNQDYKIKAKIILILRWNKITHPDCIGIQTDFIPDRLVSYNFFTLFFWCLLFWKIKHIKRIASRNFWKRNACLPSGRYKNKICSNSAKRKSYFVLVELNEISAIIFQWMFFCYFSCAKKSKNNF